MNSWTGRLLSLLTCVGLGAPLDAAPITLTIGDTNSADVVTSGGTGNRWVVGTGWDYNDLADTDNQTLAAFFEISDSLAGTTINLDDVGDSFSFQFGSIQLLETEIGGAEEDHLNLTAYLSFLSPQPETVASTATIQTINGTVHDSGVDLKITLAPVLMHLAGGEQLLVEFTDALGDPLAFRGLGTQNVLAKVTWLAMPDVSDFVNPEPASIVLLGTGGLGLLLGWRRRRTARRLES